jgi:signal peptidase II
MRRGLLLLALMLACVGCDQATKEIASRTMAGEPRISLLYDTVRLQLAENSGAFLGLGAGLSDGLRFWLLTVLNGLVIAGVLAYLLVKGRQLPSLQFVALGLIAAGGVGNLIDRVANDGRVTDFVNLGVGPVRTGIFNVADVAIMAGAAGLLLAPWWARRAAPSGPASPGV